MARWLVNASSADSGLVPTQSLAALLSTLIFVYICVTMLLALCAARSNPQVLNHRDSSTEPDADLAMESSRKLSQRFSASSTSAITKLGASFRISSFRDPSSSFRISSFRADCRQVDVVDTLRRGRPAVEEISTEPAVWQRVILRGERCSPLSFSGLILYDENGNHLPTFTNTKEQDLHVSDQQTMASSKQELLN